MSENQVKQVRDSVKAGKNICIQAGAGCGKTTFIGELAKRTHLPSLILYFNSANAKEAQEKFRAYSHVKTSTLHSLAYRKIMTPKYRKKLSFFSQAQVQSLLNLTFNQASFIVEVMEEFCKSDSRLVIEFANNYIKESEELEKLFSQQTLLEVCEMVITYFNALEDENSEINFNHNFYLKLYHLREKAKDIRQDLIYIDEAQDLNPVMIDILEQSGKQYIAVGDTNQSLYAFNGAVNALEILSKTSEIHYLRNSYRLTKDLAVLTNSVLSCFSDETIVGVRSDEVKIVGTNVILTRTNLGMFNRLWQCSVEGENAYVVGGVKTLFSLLRSAYNLKEGNYSKIYDPEIKAYPSWEAFCAAGLAENDVLIGILNKFPNINRVIDDIKKIIKEHPSSNYITLSTVHKAKGLEWDHVVLWSDFTFSDWNEREQFLTDYLIDNQRGNSLYVAVTRAKQSFNYRGGCPVVRQVLNGLD